MALGHPEEVGRQPLRVVGPEPTTHVILRWEELKCVLGVNIIEVRVDMGLLFR